MKTFKELLIELRACSDARKWAVDMPIEEIVTTCHRGDWLLWLAQKVNIPLKELTLAKGYCAKTVIHLMKDERSIKAVEAAIAFGEGNITRGELDADAVAAYAADAAAAAYAADAAAYAADAADAAAYAADAADAADAAAYAADAADAAAAAAAAAAAYAAAVAAYAAAYAAAVAAYAAAVAAYAADAADAATDAYDAYDARTKNQLETADICRKYIGQLIIDKVNEILLK
jgi:hypothetical protein